MEKLTIIFDLDGTLALIDKRRAKADKGNGKIDWKVFFDPPNIQLDEPNPPVIKTFQTMRSAGFNVGILSGRDAISRKESEKWLKKHGIYPDFFYMRPQGTFTPDDVLKKQWLDELNEEGHEIMCVYDDRDKVVKMWRDNGITCFQVAPGDF